MKTFKLITLLLATLAVSSASWTAENIKIAYIDPLSGPFANVGEMTARAFQFEIDGLNARGGVFNGTKLELVTLDSNLNPQVASLALKRATDQGIRFIVQGWGSNVALALLDAISKHNQRNPDKTALLLTYSATDPALTNDRCSFWHFRFNPDVDMLTSALTDAIAENKNIKKLYLLNQDYTYGQAVAKAGRAMLNKKRPDVAIVGDDLHPLGKVKDFAPYVAKMIAARAEAVLTGNWGNDLTLLVKAGRESGLNVQYFTYLAQSPGTLQTLGAAAVGGIKNVGAMDMNPPLQRSIEYIEAYRHKYKEDLLSHTPATAIRMLARAIEHTKSVDPEKIARALEGMKYESFAGKVVMRADNHQLIQPLFINSFARADGKDVKFDWDHSGLGFKTERRIEGRYTIMPTTCKMERPQ